jgi:hypothetical protein
VRLTVEHRDRGWDGTRVTHGRLDLARYVDVPRGGQSVADDRALQRHHRTTAAQRPSHLRMYPHVRTVVPAVANSVVMRPG